MPRHVTVFNIVVSVSIFRVGHANLNLDNPFGTHATERQRSHEETSGLACYSDFLPASECDRFVPLHLLARELGGNLPGYPNPTGPSEDHTGMI